VGGDAGVPALADPATPAPVRDALVHVAQELARQASIRVETAKARGGGAPLIQIQGLK
jgi:hypothetical protein